MDVSALRFFRHPEKSPESLRLNRDLIPVPSELAGNERQLRGLRNLIGPDDARAFPERTGGVARGERVKTDEEEKKGSHFIQFLMSF